MALGAVTDSHLELSTGDDRWDLVIDQAPRTSAGNDDGGDRLLVG